MSAVADLDQRISGIAKHDYWQDVFERYGGRRKGRFFLMAEDGNKKLLGYIMGEVRAWEFDSPPCGWVFGINVDSDGRLGGIGTALFQAICDGFRKVGVHTVRTTVSRKNELVMSFFRSQGMMASHYIQLETELDP
ncbi:MAG: GNAT family N-acetyltransferase [Alphaproteobacteria bacterium]|nr:GNAT family N-acetyltransferase [Alphaproteobacteria bacterium]MBF0355356.1 GNAT family N-acetyltransferase [Alphaproteobacteria bacterium]